MIDILLDEEMEMPCLCDCGNWFDLNDGYANTNSNKVVCKKCHESKVENSSIPN